MANDSKDPEIVVSAGKMAGMFVVAVAVCALFFGFGYSIGKEAALNASNGSGAPAVVVVGQRGASGASGSDAPAQSQAQALAESKPTPAQPLSPTQPSSPTQEARSTAAGQYFLQVAAVTKQEDAEALVSALRKKDYAVFSTNTAPSDRLYHVQIGPFSNQKDVEGLRAKLISAGYNPIVKKQG